MRKSMSAIRVVVGAPTIDPDRLACAERLQDEGCCQLTATAKAILTLSRQGMSIRQIVRSTGHSRKLVRVKKRWNGPPDRRAIGALTHFR